MASIRWIVDERGNDEDLISHLQSTRRHLDGHGGAQTSYPDQEEASHRFHHRKSERKVRRRPMTTAAVARRYQGKEAPNITASSFKSVTIPHSVTESSLTSRDGFPASEID